MKIKPKFEKGIKSVHIPFISGVMHFYGGWEEMISEVRKIEIPKETKGIEIVHRKYLSLEDEDFGYEISEVILKR